MSAKLGRTRRSVALVPLALLCAAWSVHLVEGTETHPTDAFGMALPDGSAVPLDAIEDPASYSMSARTPRGIGPAEAERMVAVASVDGIPAAALNAYRRAATVMDAADRSCHLGWPLVAAIGKVESDHGRFGDSVLGADGVARPGIYGIALDGRNRTALIRDTDAGEYDTDEAYDRAVGPMQFIPSTWAGVGVDADGDGRRDPQDIDDAALAAAVHLCSGEHDLGTDAGRRVAVHRYNHSLEYVELVLAIMDGYRHGDYSSVPSSLAASVIVTPVHGTGVASATAGKTRGGRGGGAGHQKPPPAPTPDAEPAPEPSSPPHPQPGPGQETEDGPIAAALTQTSRTVLTLAQATLTCTVEGYSPLLTRAAWDRCIAELTN